MMNRRSFIKSLCSAAVVVVLPLPYTFTPYNVSQVEWSVEYVNYDMSIEVACRVGDKTFGVRMPRPMENWRPFHVKDEEEIAFLKGTLIELLKEKKLIV